MFDPYWVRAEPYRVPVKAGQTAEATLHVRNFLTQPQKYRIQTLAPHGIDVAPVQWEGLVGPQASGQFSLRVSAAPGLKPGVYLVAFDVTRDGQRVGPWFDLCLCLE
jgi:hypothetical protein